MTDVAFYVATHPDDALVFRGDQFWADGHLSGTHLVHITVTAGDAGRIDGWWQQREAGTVAALGAAQSPAAGAGGAVWTRVNGHAIARYRGSGWTAYCLRLPDGGLDADGFDPTGHATLTKLENGSIPAISAVDGSTSYTGWDDLCGSLRALVSLERDAGTTAAPWINAADPDRTASSGDHPDHYAASDAIRSFAAEDGYKRAWWVSYDVRDRPANLRGFSLAQKRFLFEAYGWQTGGPSEDEWAWWGAKRYDRTE